jgi:hypothetical protein
MANVVAVDTSDFVNVSVSFTPLSVPFQQFGTLLIMGDSPVISTNERIRKYSSFEEVGVDFASNTPEFLASELFFEQSPQPVVVYIGRWASTATRGQLAGATLNPTQALLSNFTAITNGSLRIAINGTSHDISGINFSGALNMNGVASIIQTALIGAGFTGATCVWNAPYTRFIISSGTTGTSSSVGFGGTIGTIGATTDVSTLLGLTSASGASPLIPGLAAESALAAVQAFVATSSQWYGLMDATTVDLQQADYIAIAAYILAGQRQRIFGTTIQNTNVMDPTNSADLGSVLQSFNNRKVFWMYSGFNPYAVATMFGRGFTVDFTGNNTTITLAYKQAPGLQAEQLNETQFATLIGKGGNVNITVSNGAVMLWNGQMSNGYWFDEVQGVDWLQNQIQTDVFNLLYTTGTKIPQTDAGSNQIATAIAAACEAGVNNGLLAPGQWNADGFGQFQRGMALTKGYYIYYPPVATQAENLRQERQSVPFQVAAKLAGAVQNVNILLNINP